MIKQRYRRNQKGKKSEAINIESVIVLHSRKRDDICYTYPYGVANVGSGENSKLAVLSLLDVVQG
ncbi:MAG: hypothetical protein ACI8RD_003799 [Bacillariaceae sp.]|jgi:hypothetical protein